MKRPDYVLFFEEAHSIIPEWNQISVKGDSDFVNKKSPPLCPRGIFFVEEIFCTCGVYYHEF
jgi:hypothetical protein